MPALALTELGGVAAYRNSAGNLAVNAMQFTSTDVLLGVGEEEAPPARSRCRGSTAPPATPSSRCATAPTSCSSSPTT
ncbi:hypothetical protein [Nannocystis pusilla]|uniref:hypothetical protein n=1 Tax=Nannocystis pusilla TaxID=889268 RepID=UPI003B7FD17D